MTGQGKSMEVVANVQSSDTRDGFIAVAPVKGRTPQWCKGWIAGFCACAFLFAGYRKDYERDRDEYLARKGWTPDPRRQNNV